MTAQSNDYKPTESDIEMLLEKATGKPLKPEDATAGIASMRQRIAELKRQKAKMLDQLAAVTCDSANVINKNLTSINRDLETARERLAYYQAQLDRRN